MGREYRIYRADRSLAHSEARRLAAFEFDVELEEVHVVRALPIDDDESAIGWIVWVTLG